MNRSSGVTLLFDHLPSGQAGHKKIGCPEQNSLALNDFRNLDVFHTVPHMTVAQTK